jgi:hypothetical protein
MMDINGPFPDAVSFPAMPPEIDYPAAYVDELVSQTEEAIGHIQIQLDKARRTLDKLRAEVRKA